RAAPGIPVARVPMGIPLPPFIPPAAAPARLGLDPDAFVVSAFGEVHPHKRITVALQAFAEFVRHHRHALLLLVGQASPNYPVAELLQALGITDAVQRVGFVPHAQYDDYVAASD